MTLLARLDAACRDQRLPHELRERIAMKLEQGAGLDVLEALEQETKAMTEEDVRRAVSVCISARQYSDGFFISNEFARLQREGGER